MTRPKIQSHLDHVTGVIESCSARILFQFYFDM